MQEEAEGRREESPSIHELEAMVSELRMKLKEAEVEASSSRSANEAAEARAAALSANLQAANQRCQAAEGLLIQFPDREAASAAVGPAALDQLAGALKAKQAEVEALEANLKAQEAEAAAALLRVSELEERLSEVSAPLERPQGISAMTSEEVLKREAEGAEKLEAIMGQLAAVEAKAAEAEARVAEAETRLAKEREATAAAQRDFERADQKRAELAADLNVANRKLNGATERIVLMTGET